MEKHDTLNFVPIIHKGTKKERIEIINKIIKQIANHDRQFLSNHSDNHNPKDPKKISKFIIRNNKIFFVSHYRTKPVEFQVNSNNRDKFIHGGTLWGLINDFNDFIKYGRYSNHRHGYSGLYGRAWGYKKESIRNLIKVATKEGYLMHSLEENVKLMGIHTNGPPPNIRIEEVKNGNTN